MLSNGQFVFGFAECGGLFVPVTTAASTWPLLQVELNSHLVPSEETEVMLLLNLQSNIGIMYLCRALCHSWGHHERAMHQRKKRGKMLRKLKWEQVILSKVPKICLFLHLTTLIALLSLSGLSLKFSEPRSSQKGTMVNRGTPLLQTHDAPPHLWGMVWVVRWSSFLLPWLFFPTLFFLLILLLPPPSLPRPPQSTNTASCSQLPHLIQPEHLPKASFYNLWDMSSWTWSQHLKVSVKVNKSSSFPTFLLSLAGITTFLAWNLTTGACHLSPSHMQHFPSHSFYRVFPTLSMPTARSKQTLPLPA